MSQMRESGNRQISVYIWEMTLQTLEKEWNNWQSIRKHLNQILTHTYTLNSKWVKDVNMNIITIGCRRYLYDIR